MIESLFFTIFAKKTMNRIHSPIFNVIPMEFPKGDDYISDIEMIIMSDTGIVDAQVANVTLRESCMMLINAIKVFRLGFFDCAFYSLRQTIELSIGGLFLYSNKDKIKEWNEGKDGFEKGRMTQLLKKEDATFRDVREKLDFYFETLRNTERLIDKYVHKQGANTFYTFQSPNVKYYQNHKKKLVDDFERFIKECIGAVAIYRLMIDPLPLLLTDEDIEMRTPDLITEPFSLGFINRYISDDVVDAYKNTELYKGYYDYFSSQEKQNDAIYNLIHYQIIDRKSFDKYIEQNHLISFHDRLAVLLTFSSAKISNCYIMDGWLWYSTDVQSLRSKDSSIALGKMVFEKRFLSSDNFNQPCENIFISKVNAFGETHYIEHNAPLSEQEIEVIKRFASAINQNYDEDNKKLMEWYNSQISKASS